MSRKDVSDEQVVQAARDYHDAPLFSSPFVDELLAERTGQPRKVCERAIERAVDRGLVDYGVSLRTCFPVLSSSRGRRAG